MAVGVLPKRLQGITQQLLRARRPGCVAQVQCSAVATKTRWSVLAEETCFQWKALPSLHVQVPPCRGGCRMATSDRAAVRVEAKPFSNQNRLLQLSMLDRQDRQTINTDTLNLKP